MKFVATMLSLLMMSTLSAESSLEKVFTAAVEKAKGDTSSTKKVSSYVLTKTFDTETVSLEFPSKPKIKTSKKDGLYTAQLEQNKSEYILLAPEPAEAGIQAYAFFDYILDEMISSSYRILESFTTSENGYDFLTCHSLDEKGKMEQKFKLYVTQQNFYIVSTEYPKGKENEFHEKFRNSFKFIE